jgi:5-formyltetrahydrofolate cyclo-ligase
MPGQIAVLSPDKDHLRKRVWDEMQSRGVARFPGAWGRIPNFAGAAVAAERLRRLDEWQRARVLKCNPDSPQLAVRRTALCEGKTVYMAAPRLRQESCFLELDPAALGSLPERAATIKGAFEHGRLVLPEELRPVDLIVCGSVLVSPDGGRIGKGGGYSDLEFAILAAMKKLSPYVCVVTTVHDLQVSEKPLPMHPHDLPVDYIVTPTRTIPCARLYPRPRGVFWGLLPRERLHSIPVLQRLEREERAGKL